MVRTVDEFITSILDNARQAIPNFLESYGDFIMGRKAEFVSHIVDLESPRVKSKPFHVKSLDLTIEHKFAHILIRGRSVHAEK